MTKPIGFIRSTSDLSEERTALLANLGPLYEPYLYEEDRARLAGGNKPGLDEAAVRTGG